MAIRTIQAPGIEMNEIDRSQYDRLTDYSLPNAPTCLITGFADKGENYKTQWINSRATFIEQYGYPTNTAEQYFFNGAMEILGRGGVLLTNKLPYDNLAKDRFTCTHYSFSDLTEIGSFSGAIEGGIIDADFEGIYETIGNLRTTLIDILEALDESPTEAQYDTIGKIATKCDKLAGKYSSDTQLCQKISDIRENLRTIINVLKTASGSTEGIQLYSMLREFDPTLTSYIELNGTNYNCTMSLENFDKYITSETIPTNGITIVNIANNQYESTTWPSIQTTYYKESPINSNDCLGIMPIIVSPANALYYQGLLNSIILTKTATAPDIERTLTQYNLLSSFAARTYIYTTDNGENIISVDSSQLSAALLSTEYLTKTFESDANTVEDGYDNSWSAEFAQYFPNIGYQTNNNFDHEHFKKIGIIVVKVFQDTSNNNAINFSVLESFVGSLDKKSKDPITHGTNFIDTIVNTQSQYIRCFTNIDEHKLEKASIIGIRNQCPVSLGFYKAECKKTIDYHSSILRPLNRMFATLNNPVTTNIDIIVDSGMSNIAQYLTNNENAEFTGASKFGSIPPKWMAIVKLFDDFCKYTRKDCIFIADAPRPLCLTGQSKIVRPTNLTNTITNSIVPNLRWINVLNSSYSTGYCDWFYCRDEYTDDYFWCPPSIKAAGVYCYTDTYFHPWDAPAGMTRGIVRNVYDVAFSPTNDEAGKIYNMCWNYATNYPINGIILEGQKTFQKNQTALDRVNVRRLMLYLEKRTARIARTFLYEGNTAYLRQRLVDTLTPLFEDAKNGNGIIDYVIKCDDVNNPPEVIDRNELHVAIAVKPVKTVEYIVVNFIVTNQSANVTEEVTRV